MRRKHKLILNMHNRKNKPNTIKNKSIACPFCESNIPTIYADGLMLEERDTMYWQENKFPVLNDTYQTIVVETKKCEEDLRTYTLEYAKELFSFIFSVRDKLKSTGEFEEVLFIKNHGVASGGTIAHSHSQVVGLREQTYNYRDIEESMHGAPVFESEEVSISVSEIPRAEFYEFNVVWSKEDTTQEYVKWVQTLVKYLFTLQNQQYDSYNLLFHETPEKNILKVIPRRGISIFYIGYGIRQVPNDIHEVANEIIAFAKAEHASSNLVTS